MSNVFGQTSFFDGSNPLKITKPIRLIELFAGIGAQAKALENLGVNFEHYRICEFDKFAVASYNAVHGTNFETSDITKIHAEDLAVTETDKYCYIMTYSFPCTDLSSAGKQAGMSRDSGTRSGLLWQVERLLKEMEELPQILLMENVPEVVSDKNIKDFAEWIAFLDRLGYTSKYEILNAKNYGVPQNRERCFMVSWLGDFYYDFPPPQPLEIRLKDVLDDNVDEKYYLSEKATKKLVLNTPREIQQKQLDQVDEAARIGTLGISCVLMNRNKIGNHTEIASTLMARDYKGFGNQMMTGVVECGGGTDKIVVAGSLNPNKEVQDRVRILLDSGICQGLRATDYKDPPKILSADGVYTNASKSFQKKPLKDMSRTLKAEAHDAGVVIYE